jgi:acyl-CoA synthetase (AMP-forming)/AMP-acid ligase II
MAVAKDQTSPTGAGGYSTWWELVQAAVAWEPGRRLFIDEIGRCVTVEAFRDLALAVASTIAARGVCPGDTVCWQLPTGIEAAVVMTACARLGARQVPVMPILREAELTVIFDQTRPVLFISPTTWRGFDHRALAEGLVASSGCELIAVDLEALDVDSFGLPLLRGPLPTGWGDAAGSEDPTWVFFTSGTTGTPKGVLHTDSSVIASSNALLDIVGIDSGDVASIVFPMAHVGGPAMLGAVLRTGASCVVASSFDPVETPRLLVETDVTLLGSAAPFFLAYLAAQERHGAEPLFRSVRLCMNGGAPRSGLIAERLRSELGVGVVNGYGLTECPIATYTDPLDDEIQAPDVVGLAAPGVSVRIVDRRGVDLAEGEVGEIRLSGPQLFAGYVDGSADAAAFDDLGFIRTGDLGLLEADGQLRVTGRLKDVIIRSAENISAVEIETVLATHPQIVDVAVVGVPDERTGERVCAVIVTDGPDGALDVASLGELCRMAGLARYKCPEQILVVGALPRSAMGKVAKEQLKALAISAARDG